MHHIILAIALSFSLICLVLSIGFIASKIDDFFTRFKTLEGHDLDYYRTRSEVSALDVRASFFEKQIDQHQDVLVALADYHNLEMRNAPVPRSKVIFVGKD